MRARWWAESGGLALLVMLPYFYPLLLPGHLALYHDQLPLRNIIFAVLIDLVAFCGLFALALALVSRLTDRSRLIAGAVLAAGVLWRAGVVAAVLLAKSPSNLDASGGGSSSRLIHLMETTERLNLYVVAGLVVIFVLLAMQIPPAMRTVIRVTRIGLAGCAFTVVWLVPQLVYLATRPGDLTVVEGKVRELPADASSAPQARLVWIVLDELSYRLVFDQRPAGQDFPNLERLHDQSFSFGNVVPVGYYTDRIIPSLLTGKKIDTIRSTANGQLEYVGSRRRWAALDPASTLFGLASRNGWNPGVAGWWNPYCRIFTSVLSECSWRTGIENFLPLEVYGASSENKSVAANALVLPEHFLTRALGTERGEGEELRERNIRDYRSLMENAVALIRNQQIHFVFLHLPVPHPPGIYDRHSHQLRTGGNYLDNLTLADDTLGELLQEIDGSADGNRTAVIVSSDHSWRVPGWSAGPDWTKEEEQISHGAFDPRPVFLVHFPGQAKGVEVRSRVPELEEHEIIEAVLNRQITDEAELAAFLSTEKIGVAGYEEERSAAGQ